ncbi:iron dicitrate transport regulator FecR, partial [Achromobacter ruhlandii]
ARRGPAARAHTALDGPATPGRRVALRNLLTLAGVGVAGWAGYRHAPWQRLAADVSTGIGERRAVAVADGLHVTLNSDSALRLRRASGARGVHLLRGEILVSAQARPGAAPVRVDTGHGVLLADNARFDVRRTPGGLQLGVYEGSVALLRDGASTQAAEAGERLSYDDLGGVEPQAADPARPARVDGRGGAPRRRPGAFAA